MTRPFSLPNKKAIDFLLPIVRGMWNHGEKKKMSGTAARQLIKQRGQILIDGEPIDPEEMLDFPIWSIVVFPKSIRRVTIL